MPVRSCMRSYRPEEYTAVKHYWSIVYMNSVLHSTSTLRRGATPISSTTSIHQTTATAAYETRATGAHETRAVPPARQIPTTSVHPIRATGAEDDGGILKSETRPHLRISTRSPDQQ